MWNTQFRLSKHSTEPPIKVEWDVPGQKSNSLFWVFTQTRLDPLLWLYVQAITSVGPLCAYKRTDCPTQSTTQKPHVEKTHIKWTVQCEQLLPKRKYLLQLFRCTLATIRIRDSMHSPKFRKWVKELVIFNVAINAQPWIVVKFRALPKINISSLLFFFVLFFYQFVFLW